MKPVFFPYTFIAESVIKACAQFFKQIAVYQPSQISVKGHMQSLAADGLVDVWIPTEGDVPIEPVLKAYRNWAEHHQGSDISHFKILADRIPFFSESSVYQIRKDVRDLSQPTEADDAKPDFLLQARVFLQMAQEFDEQNLEIARNLDNQSKMEAGLYRRLRGDDEALPELDDIHQSPGYHDSSDYMVADRLRAWSTIFMADEHCPGFFLTSRRDIIDLIADALTKTEKIVPVGSLFAFDESSAAIEQMRSKLLDDLQTLAKSVRPNVEDSLIHEEEIQASQEPPLLDIYLIAGVDPPDLFSRFAPQSWPRIDPDNEFSEVRNTIILYLSQK